MFPCIWSVLIRLSCIHLEAATLRQPVDREQSHKHTHAWCSAWQHVLDCGPSNGSVPAELRTQSLTVRNVETAGHSPQREADCGRVSSGRLPGPCESLLSSCLHKFRAELHGTRQRQRQGTSGAQVPNLTLGEETGMESGPGAETSWNCADRQCQSAAATVTSTTDGAREGGELINNRNLLLAALGLEARDGRQQGRHLMRAVSRATECRHPGESSHGRRGKGAPWGLLHESTNLLHGRSTLDQSISQRAPPPNTIALGVC